MKAVHFGAGNIGRGFIGYLLRKSGYDLTFVDISEELVKNINSLGRYNVISLGETKTQETVTDVKAIGLSNKENLAKAISSADLVTLSIGANHLESTGKVIKEALKKRQKSNPGQPLDIIACENALFATDILRKSIEENADGDFLAYLKKMVGFPNCAVDRIVPNVSFKKESPIDVAVENFYEWDIESGAVKKNNNISGVNYVENLAPFLKRKIFLLNGTHALIAYLGYQKHYKYIHEAIQDSAIRKAVEEFHSEACAALNAEYNMDASALKEYSDKLIRRFQNQYLQDDLTRVGRDPVRKLSHNDRLVSPLLMCIDHGLKYDGIVTAIAAGFAYDYKNDPKAAEIQKEIHKNGIESAVGKFTGLANGSEPVKKTVTAYEEITGR
ncbi:MAG TPA: mannitol-1-phosphate 5-dehydrogenase [Ruminococcaceae bacterium]|jgi:mannitol-1-phosphate 5-dehydrogenase|nr:mannitol-1-phosphate 5-dehydrogenase [Oscillospiraceae bacterium]